MRTFHLIFGALMLCASAIQARTIAPAEASHIAATFVSHTNTGVKRVKAVVTEAQPTLIYTETENGEALFYIFNRPGKGYIIISADDNTKSVLAYSDTEEMTSIDAVPANMRAWLGEYARQIKAAKANGKANANEQVVHLAVSPLLTTTWGQAAPFNDDCPEVVKSNGETTKAVTGCVATAMSQIMKYYRHPSAAQGDLHYVWTHVDKDLVETVTRRFTGHPYDWDNMLNDYEVENVTDEQKQAVSILMADAAYSVEMQFSELSSSSATQLVPFAMNNYFGYDASAIYEERAFHDDAEWEHLICSELAEKRPVIYSGTTSSNTSHTWVIDGTDGQGMYHINWGWSGYQDGYFVMTGTNALLPEAGGTGGSATQEAYTVSQAAIFGMKPNAGGEPRVDFVSMSSESLSHTVLTRPVDTPTTYEDIWFTMYGDFLNHSNRGTDRYCEFALRFTNVATHESTVIMMPTEAPILMKSLTALEHIDIPKTYLQFLPSGEYDVEALFRAFVPKIVAGQMQFEGDKQWKTFRHLHGAPTSQRLTLAGTVPDLYLSEPLENTVATLDHLVFKATLHANADVNTYLIPLIFEPEGYDAEGQPTGWVAYTDRQNISSVNVQMSAGETKTYWFGEWKYGVPAAQRPKLLLLQLSLSSDPNGYWNSNSLLAPNYYNQSLFAPTPATAIAKVSIRDSRKTADVYTISGQHVGNTTSLKPGLYIIDGKKVVVK